MTIGRREFLRGSLSVCAGQAAFGLTACGPNAQPAAPSATPTQTNVLRRGNEAEPSSLDPALVDNSWEQAIVTDMLMGLFTEGPDGNPLYGAAENANSSPNGMTWTFSLRDHAWSDGTQVTPDDFVFAWRRVLDPKTKSKFGALLFPFKNARAIAEGKLPPTALATRAVDGRTLILELEHPAQYLRELLTHNLTFPVPRHAVEADPAHWTAPGKYLANGPYVLSERVPNDHITLVKNPKFYDAAHVAIASVIYYPTEDADAALKRFRAGELDTQNPFPADQIDWLRANLPGVLKQAPILSLDYVVLNMRRRPFGDARVREALNLAFDRDTLAAKLDRLGEPPAYNIVPPGTAGYPGGAAYDFKALAYPERVTRAQGLMRAAGYGPDKSLRTTLAIPSSPDARRNAAAIQAMWRAIGVELEIAQTDSAVTFARLRQFDFDIATANWSADYDDASNFLMLLTSANPQNYAGYSNPAYDALFAKAEAEPDNARRNGRLLKAEAVALKDNAWITRSFRTSRSIVQPYVKGWIVNPHGVNRTRWLSLDKH